MPQHVPRKCLIFLSCLLPVLTSSTVVPCLITASFDPPEDAQCAFALLLLCSFLKFTENRGVVKSFFLLC